MTNTSQLIARLSSEASVTKPMRSPRYWTARMLMVLAVYMFVSQYILGLRTDLVMQLSRPFFGAEIALLLLLLLSSVFAAILSMYPDAYQKRNWLKLPYAVFIVLAVLIGAQFFMPFDPRMVVPEPGPDVHSMECALCIGAVAIIPSALLFALIRRGASLNIWQAGSFAVLAASATGALTLRLAEANDSLTHLVAWHYVPTVLFAMIGALAGKWLLKW